MSRNCQIGFARSIYSLCVNSHPYPICLLKQQRYWRPIPLSVVSENRAEFLPLCCLHTELWMSKPTPTAGSSVNNKRRERYQVVTTVLLRIQIFWCVTPCRWASVYRRLKGTCCCSSPRFERSSKIFSTFEMKVCKCFRNVSKWQTNYKAAQNRILFLLWLGDYRRVGYWYGNGLPSSDGWCRIRTGYSIYSICDICITHICIYIYIYICNIYILYIHLYVVVYIIDPGVCVCVCVRVNMYLFLFMKIRLTNSISAT
jgi:hypothetical protein